MSFLFFNDTATTEIYTLSLHDALPIWSDAIADWPILNALLNTAAGATWVSVHHGGGVGIGYSLHAGMVVVADGRSEEHTSELQSRQNLVCRLLLEKKKYMQDGSQGLRI